MNCVTKSGLISFSLALAVALGGCGESEVITKEMLFGVKSISNNEPHRILRANWEDVDSLASTSLGSLQVSSDQSKLSFKIKHYQSYGNHLQLFIDVDKSATSGFQSSIWSGSGADYLIEDGELYRSTTSSRAWGWKYIASVDVKKEADGIVIEVEKSLLENLHENIQVGVISRTSSWNVDKLLPSSAHMAKYSIVRDSQIDETDESKSEVEVPQDTNYGVVTGWEDVAVISSNSDSIMKAKSSDNKLFVMMQGNVGAHSQLFIDSDNDANSGFQSSILGNSGADYLIEDGALYKSTANGRAWSWEYVGTVSYSVQNHVMQMGIDKVLLENMTPTIKLSAVARTANWRISTQIPMGEMVYFSTSNENTPTPEVKQNNQPVAHDNNIVTDADVPVDITLLGSDVDGDLLTFRIIREPLHGKLLGSAPHLTYVPDNGFVGADSFSFVVNDGTVDSEVADVTIGVKKVAPLFEGPFAQIQQLIQDSKDGLVDDVTYISVGDSTRAIANDYKGGELFLAVQSTLSQYGVKSYLDAVAGHTLRRWNNYDENVSTNEPIWKTTVAKIPGDGASTILNLSLGINDARYYGDGGEVERIKFHMNQALDKVLAQKPQTHIMLTMPEKLIGLDSKSVAIKQAYEEVARERGLPLINTMDILFSGGDDLTLYRADDAQEYGENIRVHLSSKGQRFVSDLILSKILP